MGFAWRYIYKSRSIWIPVLQLLQPYTLWCTCLNLSGKSWVSMLNTLISGNIPSIGISMKIMRDPCYSENTNLKNGWFFDWLWIKNFITLSSRETKKLLFILNIEYHEKSSLPQEITFFPILVSFCQKPGGLVWIRKQKRISTFEGFYCFLIGYRDFGKGF